MMRKEHLSLLSGSLEGLPYLLRVDLLAFQSRQAEGGRSVPLRATLGPLQELLSGTPDVVAPVADPGQFGFHEDRRENQRVAMRGT